MSPITVRAGRLRARILTPLATLTALGLALTPLLGQPASAAPVPVSRQAPTTAHLAAPHAGPRVLPTYDHIVVVMLENKSRRQVLGSGRAPYLASLAAGGADFTAAHAITHPSQPNYLALFSGSTQGVVDDTCPQRITADNLAAQLRATGRSFVGYSEGLPAAGSRLCASGNYARKHAPWTDFTHLPQAKVGQPFSSFPTDFTQLPTVAFVIPDICDDMHSCSIGTGDAWVRTNLGAYATWAMANNSLLVVTTDEDDTNGHDNNIPLVMYGAHVIPGQYAEWLDHYHVLATLEALLGLPAIGLAAGLPPVTDVFG